MTTQNQTIHKILIAPDKFKGSLTSTQAAEAIRRGIEERYLLLSSSSLADSSAFVTANVASDGNDLSFAGGDSALARNELGRNCASEGDSLQLGDELESICSAEEGDGCVTEVAGLRNVSRLEFRIVEIADGGDGSLEVLQKKIPGAEIVPIAVHNPLGKEVPSQILLYRSSRAENSVEICSESEDEAFCARNDGNFCSETGNTASRAENSTESRPEKVSEGGMRCAFIEMAKVSGLEMLAREERNPLCTSTYGMGEAIKAAIEQGAEEITLSIGGSATNDGGAGMLQALGYKFTDAGEEEVPSPICGGDLQRIASIEAPVEKVTVKFKVICDVTNPLLGTQGATAVYGPQKGADEEALQQLEAGLANYAAVAEKCLNIPQSCKEYPGVGAAGGVGYAGLAFLGAELIPGWKFFAQITSLEESVQWADLVITGEGSLDSQSLSGKVVSGMLNLAAQYNKEVAIFCGVNKLTPDEMTLMAHSLPKGVTCSSIASLGYPLDVCMRDAAPLLQQLAKGHPKTV